MLFHRRITNAASTAIGLLLFLLSCSSPGESDFKATTDLNENQNTQGKNDPPSVVEKRIIAFEVRNASNGNAIGSTNVAVSHTSGGSYQELTVNDSGRFQWEFESGATSEVHLLNPWIRPVSVGTGSDSDAFLSLIEGNPTVETFCQSRCDPRHSECSGWSIHESQEVELVTLWVEAVIKAESKALYLLDVETSTELGSNGGLVIELQFNEEVSEGCYSAQKADSTDSIEFLGQSGESLTSQLVFWEGDRIAWEINSATQLAEISQIKLNVESFSDVTIPPVFLSLSPSVVSQLQQQLIRKDEETFILVDMP